MLDWFRSWHGAPTDPKWLVIGKRSGAPPFAVSALMWALLDHASQADPRGDVTGFDFETYSAVSGMEEDQARAIFAALEAKSIVVNGRIAQWDKRQPKKEDPGSAERTRKHRGKESPPELPLDPPAEEKATAAAPSPRENPKPDITPSDAQSGLITPQAMQMADDIAVVAGHDLKFVPPSWCGAASRVQMWLNHGWPAPLIFESAKAQMHRKRDGPPGSIQYFEKGIATAIARGDVPLPTVVPFPSETIQVRHGKTSSSITAAADRLIAELEAGSSSGSEGASRLLPKG